MLEHLEKLIQAQELAPGDQLPTERALEKALDCSRTDVRRALAQLTIEGRVVRHVGRGTFLAIPSATPVHDSIVAASPTELMAARRLLEPQVVATAALTATLDDFAEMQRCLDGGDKTDVYEEFEAWDMALHRSFAVATHNAVITAMVDLLHSSRNDPTWGGLKRRTFSVARCVAYRGEHHDIVESLRDRDAAGAEAAMERHLDSIRNTILT
ncbi:FadR family transcriptional regulator [Nocardioides sp. BGMRC 2183]|nr:FadR family transcriptional regulator [Nocardioides sp. BGMRC 2183]